MFLYLRNLPGIFSTVSRNCFLRVWRNFLKNINSLINTFLNFEDKISITVDKTALYMTKCFDGLFFEKTVNYQAFWNYSRKTIELFIENFSAGLSKLHFICPESQETYKDFVEEIFVLFSFFRHFRKVFWSDGQKIFEKVFKNSFNVI